MPRGGGALKRVALESLGWVLVVAGIAALILPGPGLLLLFVGLTVLSTQYEWAERRVRPVEKRAKRAAAESVQTWPRVFASLLGVAWLTFIGVVWIMQPAAPSWWPFEDGRFWLAGGSATGITLVASAAIALGMVVYSFRVYRGRSPEEVERSVDAGHD